MKLSNKVSDLLFFLINMIEVDTVMDPDKYL